MKLDNFTASVAVAADFPVAAIADSAESKALVLEALQNTLLAGSPDAVDQYFATGIIQHNPMFANGIDAQKGVVGFRVEDGEIAGHWDIIAPLPGAGAAHNEAGKF